ncbi:MAG: hypothetical protein PUP92_25720, partial [Rhizonema sp. PD38]|nr:hypothetical protein [Rhizonema sp. PD38]
MQSGTLHFELYITLPGTVLRSSAIEIMGSGIGSVALEDIIKDDSEPNSEDTEVVVSLQLSKTLIAMGVILTNEQMRRCLSEYGEDAMLDAAVRLRKTGEIVTQEDKESYFLNYLQNTVKGVAVEVVTKKPRMTAVKSVATGGAAKFPTEIMQMLKNADIHLVPAKYRISQVRSVIVSLKASP